MATLQELVTQMETALTASKTKFTEVEQARQRVATLQKAYILEIEKAQELRKQIAETINQQMTDAGVDPQRGRIS